MEVVEDLTYLRDARQELENDARLRATVFSALGEIALHVRVEKRVHDSGVNRQGRRPERAEFERLRGLRNQVFLVVVTSRLFQVIAPLAEELRKGQGEELIEAALSYVLQVGVHPRGTRGRVFNEDEALLCAVLKRIGETVIADRAIDTFSRQELEVLSSLFARVTAEFLASARALLRVELGRAVTAEEIQRLIDEPDSEWAERQFSSQQRNIALQCNLGAVFTERVSYTFSANVEPLTFDAFDAFNALKRAGCPPEKWAAVAQAHLSVLSLQAATRGDVSHRLLVQRRYASDRKNPFRARRIRRGKWVLEPAASVLQSSELPNRPGHCAGFELVEPRVTRRIGRITKIVAQGLARMRKVLNVGRGPEARFVHAPLAFTIAVAEHLRTALQREWLAEGGRQPLSKVAERRALTSGGQLLDRIGRIKRVRRVRRSS
jgi:hypothetical protein